MDTKEEYLKRLEEQLKEWKNKIDMLEAKASKVSSEAKKELMREIEGLRSKKGIFIEKWQELQKAGGDAWDTAKEGVEKSASELKQALDKVVSRFK